MFVSLHLEKVICWSQGVSIATTLNATTDTFYLHQIKTAALALIAPSIENTCAAVTDTTAHLRIILF